MHGTEGGGYANPPRCPQLMLIEPAGTRVVLERGGENSGVILPGAEDPQGTADRVRLLYTSDAADDALRCD
ncbi:hypothetical protein VZ144_23560, partial [Enterobacter hormaechei]|nr:hypothetical protein [Enterobacter hormaechei]